MAAFVRTTDERAVAQDLQGFDDAIDAFGQFDDLMLREMFDDSIEFLKDLRCQLDADHRAVQRPKKEM